MYDREPILGNIVTIDPDVYMYVVACNSPREHRFAIENYISHFLASLSI